MPSDGRTRFAFLLGYPVEHSLSPAMHHAAFRAVGLNAAYLPWSVPPARRRGCRAANGLGMLLSIRARWPASAGRAAPGAPDAVRTALERSA